MQMCLIQYILLLKSVSEIQIGPISVVENATALQTALLISWTSFIKALFIHKVLQDVIME